MKSTRTLLPLAIAFFAMQASAALRSPDGKIEMTIEAVSGQLSYSISYGGSL